MGRLPSYNKILTLGSAYTDNALVGNIMVQEKVDGSQFRFGIDEEGNLVIGSKGTIIGHPDENKMFKEGAGYITSIEHIVKKFPPNSYFYAEYLQKPKHNVLKYNHVPTNHLVLFDAIVGGRYITNREELGQYAVTLGIDLIPELWRGNIVQYMKDKNEKGYSNPLDFLKRIIETTQSYLGDELVEGVVIKNYTETIILGGKVFPLFTKFVRTHFKERHDIEWKTCIGVKGRIDEFINSFKNEARWQKAIIHMKEKGLFTNTPKDIGPLIGLVRKDIEEEEQETIKNYLYKEYKDNILRKAVQGLPEWFKDQLLKNLK